MKTVLRTAPAFPVSIEPATVREVSIIQQLAHSIWPVCFKDTLLPEQIANMLENIYSPKSLMRQMEEGQVFWIAYRSRQPVGYVSAYKEEDTVWIKKLYIEPQCQGQGLGARLIDHAVAAFLPATSISLLVHRDNVPAQKFYFRLGFAYAGEKPVMMGDFPFVDYIYRKTLE